MRGSKGATVASVVAVLAATGAARAYDLYWTPWVSEENNGPPSWCSLQDEAAVGFGCSGSYCDDVRLFCETIPYNVTVTGYHWSDYFSEETSGIGHSTSGGWYGQDTDNSHVCSYAALPAVVTGVKCQGSYCDNIAVECANVVSQIGQRRVHPRMEDCSWSGFHSEEQGSVDFGPNRYIAGVECAGSYCDNKRFYVCSVANPNTGVSDPNEPTVSDVLDFQNASVTFSGTNGSNLVTTIGLQAGFSPAGRSFWYYIDNDGIAGADFLVVCSESGFIVYRPSQPGLYDIAIHQGTPTLAATQYRIEFPSSLVTPASVPIDGGSVRSLSYWFFFQSAQERMPNSGSGTIVID